MRCNTIRGGACGRASVTRFPRTDLHAAASAGVRRVRMLRRIVVCGVTCGLAIGVAQERREAARAAPRAADSPGDARIEGQILNEAGLPLRRAHIVLRPVEAGITTIGAEADDKGTFSVQQIPAGRYPLTAERGGHLPSSTCLRRAL